MTLGDRQATVAAAGRAVRTVNETMLHETLRHAHDVQRYANGLSRKARRFLDQRVIPDILRQVDNIGSATAWNQARVRNALVSVDRLTTSGMRSMHDMMARDLVDFGMTESDWARASVQRAMPVSMSMSLPSTAVIEQLATKSPMHGRLLEDWVHSIGRATKGRVEQQLRVGLVQGETIRQISDRLRGPEGIPGFARRHAETVARTAATHVSAQARMATFRANRDIVKQVRFIATLDARTSEICASHDGEVYSVDSGPRPPLHPRCRSTVVPVVSGWEELGLDGSRLSAAQRASMNGQVPATVNYEQWLRGQPVAVQREALGAAKHKLWSESKVPVTRFTNRAGASLTVEQIRKREGLTGGLGGSAARLAARAEDRIAAARDKLPRRVNQALALSGRAANVLPEVSSRVLRASGASPRTVRKAMGFAAIGDWGGFAMSPVAPVLGAVSPGSLGVALFGLGRMGANAGKAAAGFVRGKLGKATAR